MTAILRQENVWEIIESHVFPTNFPTLVHGMQYIEHSMRRAKNLALLGINY
jgi:hypothetical protein